jgi:hypothetical protein
MTFVPHTTFQRAWALCLVMALSTSYASATAPVDTPDPVAPPAQASAVQTQDADRAKVQEFLERANVKEKLQAMGVSGFWAQSRVDSLAPEEIHALAEKLEGMPAGGTLSQMDLVIVLLIAILVAIAL